MAKSRKDRIDTQPRHEGLQNPFAALSADGLPPEEAKASEEPKPAPPPKLGRVVLRRETAHRGGKTVIVAHDFASHLSLEFIDSLSRRLRKDLGCGGTTKDRSIEIQSSQADRIRQWLEQEGFRVAGVR